MRKWVPSGCFVGEAIYQTVVPVKFRGLVLGAFHGVGCRRFVGRCLPVSPLVVGYLRFVGGLGVRWSLVALGFVGLTCPFGAFACSPPFFLFYSRLVGLLMRMGAGLLCGDTLCPRLLGGRVTASSAVNWLHLARWLKRTSRERGSPSFVRSTFLFELWHFWRLFC